MDPKKKPYWGFAELFDFSETRSLKGKTKNILFVYSIDLIWTFFITLFLVALIGLSREKVYSLLSSGFGDNFFSMIGGFLHPAIGLPQASDIYGVGIEGGATAQTGVSVAGAVIFLFFRACILAPLWEEAVFRVLPIKVAQVLGKKDTSNSNLLLWTCIASSIIFGIGHGSVFNILLQGVGGLLFSWLYLKNNNSYWSVVGAHFLWNFMIIFGLPVILFF